MPKFCGKCGNKLDDRTGLCPNCNKDELQKTILTESKQSLEHQEDNTAQDIPIQQEKSLTAKQKREKKKAEKRTRKEQIKANRTFGQKVKRFFIFLLVWILVLSLISGAVAGVLSYFNMIEIPVFSDFVNRITGQNNNQNNYSDSDIVSDFHPELEDIAYDANEGVLYFNNVLIVYTKPGLGMTELENIAKSVDGELVGYIDGSMNVMQIKIPASSLEEIQSKADLLMNSDSVIFAGFDYPREFDDVSADSNPWNKSSNKPESDRNNESKPKGNDWWAEAIGAYTAWEYTKYAEPITIGILDSGFDDNHEDLTGSISFLDSYRDNTESNHGTHVAGVIGANNNTIGIRGVADTADLLCVDWSPFTNDKNSNNYVSYLSNYEYLTIIDTMIESGARVINNSWGYPMMSEREYTKTLTNITFDFYLLEQVIVKQTGAYDSYVKLVETTSKLDAMYGILHIAQMVNNGYGNFMILQAAGNGYDNSGPGLDAIHAGGYCGISRSVYDSLGDGIKNWLSSCNLTYDDIENRIMIVGAVKNSQTSSGDYIMTDFSNFGNTVDICAPGQDVYSTFTSNTYGNDSGTSMACPIVAGSIGYVWSLDPEMSVDEVRRIILQNTSCNAKGVGSGSSYTYPMLNVGLAAKAAFKPNRDVVLVLDSSGSMEGTPLNETKKAATKFVDTVFEQSANVGVVKYDSEAEIVSPFSTDSTSLKNSISNIRTGGSTDIEDGLATAEAMLSRSSAKKKIIVLMSDGVPNDGKVGEELIAYADELKQKDIYIYTLGFFEDLGSEKSSAQYLMERIASTGCHYEVTDANSLVYFFGDIADQINGQKYIYVRIACPVDVSVSYAGEELDSSANNLNTRTSFGTLTFEDASDYGNYDSSYYSDSSDSDDTVKVLRLKEGTDYDVKIVGTGSGRMNYSIGFMDNEGEYTDLRRFNNIRITRRTVIDTVAEVSDNTILNVDEDGDGRYDIKYKADANGYGKEVNYSYIVYILLSLVGILLILISILIIKTKINKKRKAR